MAYIIREGRPEDMPGVLNLINELAVYEKQPKAVKITVNDLLSHGFKKDPDFFSYVAEQNGALIGMAIFYKRFSTWLGPSLHLEDLIVTKKSRGSGVGRALYDKVLAYALEKNVQRVEWVVLDWNTPAIDFYKSTGATMLEDWNICQMTYKNIQNYLAKK